MNFGDRQVDGPIPIDSKRAEKRNSSSHGLGMRGRLRFYGPLLLILVAGAVSVERVDPSIIREEGFIQDSDKGQVRLSTSDSAPETASAEDQKRLGIIRQRMIDLLKNGNPGMSTKVDSMEWTVVVPSIPIHSVKVEDNKGIVRTDFPDKTTGREDLTGGPGTGPTIKGWQWGKTYALAEAPVLAVQKDETSEQTYWLMLPTSQGGWGDVANPHIEAARVSSYDSRRDPREIVRAELFDKDGNKLSPTQLMNRPLAQFVLKARDFVKSVVSTAPSPIDSKPIPTKDK